MTYEIQKMVAAKIAEIKRISAEIQPLLMGKGPEVQSAVLADLVSLWQAGLWPQAVRDALLAEFVTLVKDLVPLAEVERFGKGGHPGRRSVAGKP